MVDSTSDVRPGDLNLHLLPTRFQPVADITLTRGTKEGGNASGLPRTARVFVSSHGEYLNIVF